MEQTPSQIPNTFLQILESLRSRAKKIGRMSLFAKDSFFSQAL